MFRQSHREVATAIKGLRAYTAEVTLPRNRNIDQAIKEFIHPRFAQRHLAANGVAVSDLEASNRFARQRDNHFLTSDGFEVRNSIVQLFTITDRLTNTHIQSDLSDTRYFHDVVQPKLLFKLGL